MPQASNKAWGLVGLVAETVKAISAHHGGIIHTHRAIWSVVHEPARLAGDAGDRQTQDRISNSFTVARSRHANFYADKAYADDVRAVLAPCAELSERLYELFWRPAGV